MSPRSWSAFNCIGRVYNDVWAAPVELSHSQGHPLSWFASGQACSYSENLWIACLCVCSPQAGRDGKLNPRVAAPICKVSKS